MVAREDEEPVHGAVAHPPTITLHKVTVAVHELRFEPLELRGVEGPLPSTCRINGIEDEETDSPLVE